MVDLAKVCIPPTASLRDALRAIDAGAIQAAFVTDPERKLLGLVTDGDIRRALLGGADLTQAVEGVMNRRPRTIPAGQSRGAAIELMKEARIHQVPAVDTRGVLTQVLVLDEVMRAEPRPNTVILMAGGRGERLRPLTENCPKPMLEVGGRPLLETTLRNFIAQGFSRFYISLNYMAETIERHFGDGSRWGVSIRYLREPRRLGTVGALTLLPEAPAESFILTNGDVLTTLDFGQLLDHHVAQGAEATMGLRDYEVSVPYGVVDVDGVAITGLREKPVQRLFVNAGIYAFEPSVLAEIPRDEPFDVPSLFERLREQNRRTVAFHVREYWLDIGRPEDLARARQEFANVFGG